MTRLESGQRSSLIIQPTRYISIQTIIIILLIIFTITVRFLHDFCAAPYNPADQPCLLVDGHKETGMAWNKGSAQDRKIRALGPRLGLQSVFLSMHQVD